MDACAQIRGAAQSILLTQLLSYYDDNLLSANQGSVIWFQVCTTALVSILELTLTHYLVKMSKNCKAVLWFVIVFVEYIGFDPYLLLFIG